MNTGRIKAVFTLLPYIYWPAAYFGIYLPFIVPRLDAWRHIPYWIPISLGFGFVLVLANMGMRYSTKANVIHAIGIWISVLLFMFLMAELAMPGFKKSEISALFTINSLLITVLSMLLIFAATEGGRVLLTRKTGLRSGSEPFRGQPRI